MAENLALSQYAGKPVCIQDGMKHMDREKALTLLEELEINPRLLDVQMNQLSGGQRQLISFVMATQLNPQILLLDEVTSALDEENSRIIREMIYRLNKDEHLTVLWITHNKEEFLSSKRRLFIEDGFIKENTHE